MANIFGKCFEDYSHLVDLRAAGGNTLQRHLDGIRRTTRGELNFRVYDDISRKFTLTINDDVSQAFGLQTNTLQAIMAEILEIQYTKNRLDEMLPIVTNIPQGARSYAYKVLNKYAEGAFIENNGTNAPTAQISAGLISATIGYAGIVPTWTRQDLLAAQFEGIPLDTETIDAAIDGAMRHMEKVGFLGDTQRGFEGLFNNSGITSTAASATFALATEDQILAMVQGGINTIIEQTAEVFGRNITTPSMTIYLPVKQFNDINTRPLGFDKNKSIMTYIKQNNAWTERTKQPLQIESVIELKGIASGGADRMLIGVNDRVAMEMANPIPPRVINLIDNAYVLTAPLEYSISQLSIKHSKAFTYVDGI